MTAEASPTQPAGGELSVEMAKQAVPSVADMSDLDLALLTGSALEDIQAESAACAYPKPALS